MGFSAVLILNDEVRYRTVFLPASATQFCDLDEQWQ